MIIKNNKVVFVDYTLKNESGTVIDTSFGKAFGIYSWSWSNYIRVRTDFTWKIAR